MLVSDTSVKLFLTFRMRRFVDFHVRRVNSIDKHSADMGSTVDNDYLQAVMIVGRIWVVNLRCILHTRIESLILTTLFSGE